MNEFDNELEDKFTFDFSAPADLQIDLDKIKSFVEKSPDPVLIFYGGEPLMKYAKIKEIIDKINCRFMIQTNGLLLNILEQPYLNKIEKMLVSIDGDKERTDFNRGDGTFDRIIKNIKLIRSKGYKGEIVARMTLSFPDIYKQAKHLVSLIKEGIFDSIHWQLDVGFYKNDYDKEKFEEFVHEYNNQITKLLDLWVEEISNGNLIKIYPFLGIFESIHKKEKTLLRCGAGYENYTITTHGKITACPIANGIEDFYCGDINSNPTQLKKIFVGEPCASCSYLDLCGGRCLYENKAALWPKEGKKQICQTIIHLIESIKQKTPEIETLINQGNVEESQFSFEKYFGPEIIP